MATKRTPPVPTLPVISVARLQAVTTQVDGLVEENVDVFARHGQRYIDAWREHSERAMNPDEVAQIAGALGAAVGRDDLPGLLSEVQSAGLRTRTSPQRSEALLAAGIATAPAFITAMLRLVALLELPAAEFEEANESGTLDLALVEPVRILQRLSIGDARLRVKAGLDHLSAEAGVAPGELLGLISRMLGTTLSTAIGPLSQFGSVIGSLAPTGGVDESASTDSPGDRPVT